ncbi:hypothetical protein P4N68_08160 [Corynebacterium felinum]|nr:ABC transporter permease [Corynebacterium felinum]MDF5821051.1 hypothetical protein [Corynebacterium felinum]WJY94273.1 ABC-2 family transporter protein [Corynebacterium felinum]
MNRLLRLELGRYYSSAMGIGLATFTAMLGFLYFFALVGKMDQDPANAMFRQYSAVFAMSFTISMCVAVIYGAVVYARFIVTDYVGNRRIQLYTYPLGRKTLFLAKNIACASVQLAATFLGLLVATCVFFLSEAFSPLVEGKTGSILWIEVLLKVVVVTFLALALSLISGIVGMWRRSVITTIIVAILAVCMAGNIIAFSLNASVVYSAIATVVAAIVAVTMVVACSKHIAIDEVL